VVSTASLPAGLAHLIMFRPFNAFFNPSLIVTAPVVILIGTGGHRRLVFG